MYQETIFTSTSEILSTSFDSIISPYKNSESIPTFIINDLLTTIFPSHMVIHEYSQTHKIIKIPIKEFSEKFVQNWQYNRNPDLIRCKEIAKYIYKTERPVDTMFYLSFNGKTKLFDIIDGIHRYTALKIIEKENSKPEDLLTPSEFGHDKNAHWLFDSFIILNIRFNASEGEIIDLFQTLNKSISIPELYVRDFTLERRNIIQNISKKYQNKYPTHFSSSAKPQRPNINKDVFEDKLLDILYDKYNISNDNKDILEEKLEEINVKIANNLPKKISKTITEKCRKTGLWLFIYNVDELIKMI